jgi:hypothetical protein
MLAPPLNSNLTQLGIHLRMMFWGYTKIPAKAAIEFRQKDSHIVYAQFLGDTPLHGMSYTHSWPWSYRIKIFIR